MPTDTIKKLAEITDAAQFERIATSVLRAADPALYGNLSHQGVNTDGKTVKAPLDNIGWVHVDGYAMCVAAAHTTASRDDLEGKWLHDPATVTPRKTGGKPTQAAGDLIKAIEVITKLRTQHPGLKATLALTCNREEPTDVRTKAEGIANRSSVVLDIWSVSRIAQHLDTTPEGQAIRRAYLDTPVNLLSREELLRVGVLSLNSRFSPTDPNALVSRHGVFDGTSHMLLSGPSGMGKTTICFENLRNALAEGQPGIVLNDQTVRDATSIEDAIEIELSHYLPQLEPLAGTKALELCSELKPFVVVVEDINRAENTTILLNKLASWALHGMSQNDGNPRRKWRMLCPVWPRFLAGLEKSKEVNDAGMVHIIGLFLEDDAREAVKRRGEALGYPQNDLAAAEIARALGYDPLLVGLYDFASTADGKDVIAQYIHREFDRVALSSDLTFTDLEMAVNALMTEMLQRRRLTPTWREAQAWLGEGSNLHALRALVTKGGVLRLNKSGVQEVVEARHDRVLHSLLANFIATVMKEDLQVSYLSDPYLAEFVGTGASLARLDPTALQVLMRNSPLVGFYAFKHAVQLSGEYAAIAARAIKDWVCQESTRTQTFSSRRWRGLQILAEIDSPAVLELTSKFPQDDLHQPLFEARFRNGDLNAALNWLTEYPFEVNFGGRQELVDHVHNKYGRGLVQAVEKVLEDPTSTGRARRGALYLAGYLADPILAKSVRTVWKLTDSEERDLEAFLWASARVCGDEALITLEPVCDAWEALPEQDDSFIGESSRSSLAAHGLSWKFRDHVPHAALPYFVQRAKQSETLKWPITYMLRGIDDPVAVQHEVEYLAERSREAEGTGGMIDHFLKDEWRRQTEDHGRKMSDESKQRLLDIAMNLENDPHLQVQAFSLWEVCVSAEGLDVARAIKAGDLLHDKAVWARARRSDLTVIPELLEKIKENPRFWWQAGRYIWASELTNALEESLRLLGTTTSEEKHEDIGEWLFPELLLRLDLATAERLIVAVWPVVRTLPKFVQVALCLASPKLIGLANAAISEAAEPHKLFEHFSFTAGLHISGRAGFTRLAQLEAVRPHLSLFAEADIVQLWEVCNRRNWRQFRKEHLDPFLVASQSPHSARLAIHEHFDMSDLEDELAGKRWGSYHWLEQQLRNGAEREPLFAAILRWVHEKSDVTALAVASQIFSNDATRTEFVRLEEIAAYIDDSEAILEQTKFDVFHRTLV